MRRVAPAVFYYLIFCLMPAFAIDWNYWEREAAGLTCEAAVDLAFRRQGFSVAKAVASHFGCAYLTGKMIPRTGGVPTPRPETQCQSGYALSEIMGTCVRLCAEGWDYDATTKHCKSNCRTGEIYDQERHKCTPGCPSGKIYDSFWQVCMENCPSGQDYDWLGTRKCVVCRAGATYDSSRPPGQRCKS